MPKLSTTSRRALEARQLLLDQKLTENEDQMEGLKKEKEGLLQEIDLIESQLEDNDATEDL